MGHIIHAVLSLLIVLGILGWWMYRSLRRSEEPVGLIAKRVITALMIPAIFFAAGTGVFMPIFGAIIGVVMAVVWARSIAGAFARPFVNLFTGGETPPDPQPYYSIAEARRKKGAFREA